MTRVGLLVCSVYLYVIVASINCTEGSQTGTADEKSSRGKPLNGISNDVLAKLNSDQDLQKFWQDAFKTGLTLDSNLEELAEFSKNESKSYPVLLKKLKNIAKILGSDPFIVKLWEFINSTNTSYTATLLPMEKEWRSNPALARKLIDIVSKAMETDPDLDKVWKNAAEKGLSENSTTEEWKQFLTDATESNEAVEAKLNEFFEKSMRSVQSVLMVYAAFGDDLKTNGAYQPTIFIAPFTGAMLLQYCYKIYFF